MRDIKFRAWNDIDKSYIDWMTLCGMPKLITNIARGKEKHYQLEQYTGLKDKNGVEIYEGDIITAGIRGGNVLSTYSIDFDSIYGCWYGNLIKSEKLGNKDCRPIGELRFNAEVIGNIHQNPELLGN